MTHGAGSCGGGGYSGGGFSGGGFAYGHWGGRGCRRPHHDRDSRRKCCICLCTLFLALLCLGKLTRKQRLGVLWFYVITVTIMVSMAMFASFNGVRNINVAPLDMRVMETSTFFSSEMSLSSNSKFDAYLFKHKPRIVTNDSTPPYTFDPVLDVPPDSYEYYGFYLLSGSTLQLRACSYFTGNLANMYVIQGRDRLDTWITKSRKENYKQGYIYNGHVSTSNGPCTWDRVFDTFTFRVTDSDDYYFLFANLYEFDTNMIHAHIRLNRTIYDLTDGLMTSSCQNVTSCHYPLTMHSSEVVVMDAPATYSNDDDMTVFRQSRSWTFVVLFLAVPLVFGACASLFVFFVCKDPKKSDVGDSPRGYGTQTTASRASVSAINVQATAAPGQPPPAYSSDFNTAYSYGGDFGEKSQFGRNDLPPSYSQAVQ